MWQGCEPDKKLTKVDLHLASFDALLWGIAEEQLL
jgi:hypothetical protein